MYGCRVQLQQVSSVCRLNTTDSAKINCHWLFVLYWIVSQCTYLLGHSRSFWVDCGLECWLCGLLCMNRRSQPRMYTHAPVGPLEVVLSRLRPSMLIMWSTMWWWYAVAWCTLALLSCVCTMASARESRTCWSMTVCYLVWYVTYQMTRGHVARDTREL